MIAILKLLKVNWELKGAVFAYPAAKPRFGTELPAQQPTSGNGP